MFWTSGGLELKSAHGAVAHIGQPVQRGNLGGRDTLICHVAVDQGVAEVIGQGVAQHGGQTFASFHRQICEYKSRSLGGGHLQRCGLDAGRPELWRIAEDVKPINRIKRHCANAPIPKMNVNDVHMFVAGGWLLSYHGL